MKKKIIINIVLLIVFIFISIYCIKNYMLLKKGIEYYNTQNYEDALSLFNHAHEKDLTLDKDFLLVNSAKTAYKLKKYDSALEYAEYFNDENTFLMRGNSFKKAADESNNMIIVLKYYDNALGEYKQGIREFQGDKELIYNYEFLKREVDRYINYLKAGSTSGGQNYTNEKRDEVKLEYGGKNLEILQMLDLKEQNVIQRNLKFKTQSKKDEEKNDW